MHTVISDINTVPVINSNNLPYTTVVLENSPLGSSVYQVEITDPDAGDIHTYTASFTPAMASNYFIVDSTSKNVLCVIFQIIIVSHT
jgi:hypothetical protein